MTSIAPPILRTAVVARPLAEAFAVFTDEIGAWWPLPSHSVFRDRAGGVHFVDDRLVEFATDGGHTTWAEVLEWEPPHRLVMAWHPGAGPETAGRVEIVFVEEGQGTRVELRHDGWEAFGDDAVRRRRSYVGPSAWGHVLDQFADGAEVHVGSLDVSGLRSAYAAFFDEASAGGFGPPTDRGWNADQVVAHVALNDLAMIAVSHSLAQGGKPTFDNRLCQDVRIIDVVVQACGSSDGVLAFGRRCAAQAVAAVVRLDEAQRSTPVACRLEHDGAVMADATIPWDQVAVATQANRHLPSHLDQLTKLRGVAVA